MILAWLLLLGLIPCLQFIDAAAAASVPFSNTASSSTTTRTSSSTNNNNNNSRSSHDINDTNSNNYNTIPTGDNDNSNKVSSSSINLSSASSSLEASSVRSNSESIAFVRRTVTSRTTVVTSNSHKTRNSNHNSDSEEQNKSFCAHGSDNNIGSDSGRINNGIDSLQHQSKIRQEGLPPLESQIEEQSQVKEQNSIEQREETKERQRTLMDYESIALALRLTCEMNRRLINACVTKPSSSIVRQQSTEDTSSTDVMHPPQIHPHYKLTTDLFNFSSSSSSSSSLKKNHIINLSTYVQSISKILGYDINPIIPAIALIYLDRACSFSTTNPIHGMTHNNNDTTNDNNMRNDYYMNTHPKRCPYITINTVHKLFLTAIVLACRTVRNQYPTSINHGFHDEWTTQYASLLQSNNDSELLCDMNVTNTDLGNWLNYMVSSLSSSDHSLIISTDELNLFLRRWKNLFQWEDDSVWKIGDNNSLDTRQMLLGLKATKNGAHERQNQHDSAMSSSPWEQIYDSDDSSYKEDSIAADTIQQEGYLDIDNNNNIDRVNNDFDNSQGHQNGEFHYYERQEIHYSQPGYPDFGDGGGGGGGDNWWST